MSGTAGDAGARRSPAVQLGFLWGAAATGAVALAPFLRVLLKTFAPALPRCPVQLLAGIPCPACGSGRAMVALARLEIDRAFVANPLFTLLALAFVLGGFAALALALAGRGVREPRTPTVRVRVGVVLAVAANWCWLLLDGR